MSDHQEQLKAALAPLFRRLFSAIPHRRVEAIYEAELAVRYANMQMGASEQLEANRRAKAAAEQAVAALSDYQGRIVLYAVVQAYAAIQEATGEAEEALIQRFEEAMRRGLTG